jgi:hypothetical protein
MRESEYRRERKKIAAELKEAEQAVSKVQEKLAALDLLWNTHFSKSKQEAAVVADTENTNAGIEIVNGQAKELIDEAAKKMEGEFGVKQIETAIQSAHPGKMVNRTTIAGRLRVLVEEGTLELVEEGQGRRPGRFRGRAA